MDFDRGMGRGDLWGLDGLPFKLSELKNASTEGQVVVIVNSYGTKYLWLQPAGSVVHSKTHVVITGVGPSNQINLLEYTLWDVTNCQALYS